MKGSLLIPRREIHVIKVGGTDADLSGFSSEAIQMAVDILRCRGGGIIKLNEGIFNINAPVKLYDNMTLIGMGEKTLLRKGDGFKTDLEIDCDYGEIRADVKDISGFKVGMGIQVVDSVNCRGFTPSYVVITYMENNTIYFDRNLIENYMIERDASISNTCTIIEVDGAQNVKILDLAIDGNKDKNELIIDKSGIFLSKSSNCTIENIRLYNYNGDGICWATTEDIAVRNCEVEGCTVFGIHPGAGTVRTVVEGCNVHDNGADGIYLCWRVQEGMFRNNRTHNNNGSGISIGHKDTDNCFEANHIHDNAISGIFIRKDTKSNSAHRNKYRKNLIEDNGRNGEGYGFFFNAEVGGNIIEENLIRDTGKKKQQIGILLQGDPSKVRIENNEMLGHIEGDIVNRTIMKNNWVYLT